jgi:enoyl-CoA hydratase
VNQPLVLIDKQAGICRITLNRPEALNALSSSQRNALADVLAELAEDRETQVVILTGAGRAFTVGLDLKELGGELDASGSVAASQTRSEDLGQALNDLPQPVIGAINGFAITGGFELALMCDFLIASTEARFADTHARVGVVPGWGLSQRLPRLIGINRAKELSLTGNFLDAETACQWGLVNRVVAPEELLPTAESLALDIVTTEPVTRAEILRIMDAGWATSLAEGLEIEKSASIDHSRREVRSDKIASRRRQIQSRGRIQSS